MAFIPEVALKTGKPCLSHKKEYLDKTYIPSFFCQSFRIFANPFLIMPAIGSGLFQTRKNTIMSYEAEGKLYKKMDVQQVTDSFKKREFVVEIEDGAYTQLIKFQLTQANCDKLEPFNEGDRVKVTFSIRGREYTKDGRTSYFTNLDAWRLESTNQAAPANAPAATTAGTDFPAATDEPTSMDDDLPF